MADALVVRHAEDVMRQVHGAPRHGRETPEGLIGTSWVRCVNDYRLDPSRMYSPTVVDSGHLKDRQSQLDELVAIADAEMESLYDQISGSGYALLLTDASGIILCEKLDPALRKPFRGAGLLVGADWSEKHEGTNGIGTCIAENRSVTVHRNDHFRARHIGLSCTGSPIRDPAGSLIAVLDASTVGSHDTRASQMHTLALVNLSANLIEKCLFLRRHQKNTVLRFHSRPELVNLLHDGALALADDGTVMSADETATRLLGASDRRELVGRPLTEIFDAKLDELTSAAAMARQAIWPARDLRRGRRFFLSLQNGKQRVAMPDPMPTREERTIVQMPARPASVQGMTLEDVAGEDPQMLRNIRCARRVADQPVSVLIQGATGSGKEAFARALHLASSRAAQPYVAVNCAAIPETLIESELFGYKSGAFTGARKEGMKGKILQSSGGTLFLDEIGDMPLALQTRLLRVLEEQEIVPLGAEAPVKVDLRVISASHRKLREMIERGEFREDLYYRLNGITLELPPLAARADKEKLIRRYLAAECSNPDHPSAIEPEAFARLMNYAWPGNIRELRNVVRTAQAISEDGVVRLADLPREIREYSTLPAPAAKALPPPETVAPENPANPLETAEREALLRVIEQHCWNMSHTAESLGISRNTLYRKIRRHGIPVGAARRGMA